MRRKFVNGVRFRSAQNEKGEWFAVGITFFRNINLWHIVPGTVRLYTFRSVEGKYDITTFWHEKMCRELLKDLMSPKPSVDVLRFAVNGQLVFAQEDVEVDKPLPRTPEPLTEEEVVQMIEREKAHWEEMKMFEGPAPYILYGTHYRNRKEYAWKLFPDKKARMNIKPGDFVKVRTDQGVRTVKVTRIEEAGDTEQPKKWVIQKERPRRSYGKKTRKPEHREEQPEAPASSEE